MTVDHDDDRHDSELISATAAADNSDDGNDNIKKSKICLFKKSNEVAGSATTKVVVWKRK